MTTYCAPCLADLALVREASTAVSGTASCLAHAVLLTHPGDDPQRRRQRLAQLRDAATEKLETAGPEERLRLEILVEEYGLASAMESLAPRRRPEEGGPTSRSARKRRGRDGRERPEGGGQDGRHPQGGRGPRPGGDGRPQGAAGGGQDVPAEPGAGAAVADGTAEQQGADALAQVGAPSGEPPAAPGEQGGGSAPEQSAPEAGSAPQQASAPEPSSAPQQPSSPTPSSAPEQSPSPAQEPPAAAAPSTPEPASAPAPQQAGAADAPAERPTPSDATPES